MKVFFLIAAILGAGLFFFYPGKTSDKENHSVMALPVFCAPSFDTANMRSGNAPLFTDFAKAHIKLSTGQQKAQQYFDQGLTLIYAFNHGEAARSFYAALKYDSTLAMAYWGLGMVLGPNYNAALNQSLIHEIWEVMDKAKALSINASPKEKALIDALCLRFPKETVNDMTPYAAAYASAMKEVFEKFPDDAEVAALYADAIMNEHPWNFWLKDGTAQPWTAGVMQVLEESIRKFPKGVGLHHMYIHAVEASRQPEKGLASAALLEKMVPGAAHLVHMPSHIYIRTGHYHRGVLVNEWASDADSQYVTQCKVQGTYPIMYYPHNVHFLAACAYLEGNSEKALKAAWMVNRIADKRYILENVTVQHYSVIPFYVMVQTAKWDDILQLPPPGESLLYPRAIWHYARGMAFNAKGKTAEAQNELAMLKSYSDMDALDKFLVWETNNARQLVTIAYQVLKGDMALQAKQFQQSFEAYKAAIAIEDALTYQEPPDWFFSVRHSLGHASLVAGDYKQAEVILREDLQTFPENGWALMGLYKALSGQKKTEEALAVKKRFEEAWKYADIEIQSSRKF